MPTRDQGGRESMAPPGPAVATPPRRNPGRHARDSNESPAGAVSRNPYKTPTRISARLRSVSIPGPHGSPQQHRTSPGRKRTQHERHDTDVTTNNSSAAQQKRAKHGQTGTQSGSRFSNPDLVIGDTDAEHDEHHQPTRRSQRNSRKSKGSPDHRPGSTPPRDAPPPRPRKVTREILPTAQVQKPESQAKATIPNWQGALPYMIWVQILTYAAAAPNPFGINASWLVQTARVCQAIADPAITVLYRCPPLSTEQKAIGLVHLLRRPPSRLKFNYRAKIKSLHIDVLMVSLTPGSLAGPNNLLRNLSQLREIHIVHPLDAPPYRNLTHALRWNYNKELFDSLEVDDDASEERMDKTSHTRLESWVWNERMMKARTYVPDLPKIREIHTMASFTSLRRLRFINFQIPSFSAEERSSRIPPAHIQELIDAKDRDYTQGLATALAALPQLESLAFESSTCVNSTLLPLFPTHLRQLELVNCWEVSSDVFASFLASHGSRMETLTLNHNQALNLAFLTGLGQSCPRLKELRMNMFYYRHHEFLDDSDPFYEFLLLEDQTPSWPPTLQILDMENLRGWTEDAANMFFQSLADSARNLPNLRHLTIKAMLNISWRQRSEVRQGWQDRLRKIFLRPFVPPISRASLVKRPRKQSVSLPARDPGKSHTEPSRRSTRLMEEEPGSRSLGTNVKPKGLRTLGRQRYEEPDSDEFDEEMNVGKAEDSPHDAGSLISADANYASASGSSPDFYDEEGVYTQGLCDTVEISIDNQKPREQQYNMDDFMDELGTEGDETDAEWDGRAEFV